MTLSEVIGKMEEGVKADEGFRHMVERMEKNLIRNRKKKYLITVAWPQILQAFRQITLFEERCRKSVVYPLIDDIIVKASDIYAYLYNQGLLISDADILIASTALVYNLTLITRNLEHFNRIPDLTSQSWK